MVPKPTLPCVAIGEQMFCEQTFQSPEQLEFAKILWDAANLKSITVDNRKVINVSQFFYKDSFCFFGQWWLKYRLNDLKCDNCNDIPCHVLCEYHAFLVCVVASHCKLHKIEYCVPLIFSQRIPKLTLPIIPRFSLGGTRKTKTRILEDLDTDHMCVDELANFHIIVIHPKSTWKEYVEVLNTSYVIIRIYPEENLVKVLSTTLRNLMEIIIEESKRIKIEWKTVVLLQRVEQAHCTIVEKVCPRNEPQEQDVEIHSPPKRSKLELTATYTPGSSFSIKINT